jgi:uncharacterized protein
MYLLDVNVLLAWGWSDHVDHERTVRWIASEKKKPQAMLATCAIVQIGFVRVSVHRSLGQVSVAEAAEILGGMLKTLGENHVFLPDDADGLTWPGWCRNASQTTDAHLAVLAQKHGLELATLDEGIPQAYGLPR